MYRTFLIFVFIILFAGAGYILAQDTALPDDLSCEAADLADLQATYADIFAVGSDDDPTEIADQLFKLGALYQELALACNYLPSQAEVDTLIEQTLSIAPLSQIIAATAVGDDIASILAELDTLMGDSFNGQLLYNGLEAGIDGVELGCTACHNNVEIAPLIEGTYTRIEEIRLSDPALADYTIRQYLVESIVRPADYLIPEYVNQVMPINYGTRMDIQQLADIIAYLESQDQLLDE